MGPSSSTSRLRVAPGFSRCPLHETVFNCPAADERSPRPPRPSISNSTCCASACACTTSNSATRTSRSCCSSTATATTPTTRTDGTRAAAPTTTSSPPTFTATSDSTSSDRHMCTRSRLRALDIVPVLEAVEQFAAGAHPRSFARQPPSRSSHRPTYPQKVSKLITIEGLLAQTGCWRAGQGARPPMGSAIRSRR